MCNLVARPLDLFDLVVVVIKSIQFVEVRSGRDHKMTQRDLFFIFFNRKLIVEHLKNYNRGFFFLNKK